LTHYRQHKDIAWRNIDGETVLIDPASGTIFVLNRVGSKIWKLLEEPRSPVSMVQAIASDFEVQEVQALDDLLIFLEDLSRRNLVEEVQ